MKVDEAAAVKAGAYCCEGDSLVVTENVMSLVKEWVMNSVEVMTAAKWLVNLEVSDVEINEKSRELSVKKIELVKRLEAKVGVLETLLLAVMSTNKELRCQVDEMSVEVNLARKMKARYATAVAEMGAPISHFGNIANYVRVGGGEGNWEKDWDWDQTQWVVVYQS
ncbi:hypothetical protein EJB05_26108, partial [Eragrostis curvula]